MTRHIHLYTTVAVLFVMWTLVVCLESYVDISTIKQVTVTLAKKEAVTNFNKDLSFRLWATQHGGIYVPVSARTQPNKYLAHLPERDITTPSGKKLTLMNPAYMIRQVMEDHALLYGTKGSITSLNPLNPANKADDWQRNALEILKSGKEQEVFEITQGPGESYLRFMRPLITRKPCLKCHELQGYKVGDQRGGIEVKINMAPYLSVEKQAIKHNITSAFYFWFFGTLPMIFILLWGGKKIANENLAKEQLRSANENLQKSLAEIKTLRGIIPICAYCKKIRDDQGSWERLEAYIHSHSEAEFSHGVCPECYKKEMED